MQGELFRDVVQGPIYAAVGDFSWTNFYKKGVLSGLKCQ